MIRNLRLFIIPGIFILTIFLLCIFTLGADSPAGKYEIAARVDGEPIMVGEVMLFMQKHRWQTPGDGEAPLERLRKIALDEAVKAKVQQAMAKRKGILNEFPLTTDIDYKSLTADLEKENRRRKDAVKHHKVIYGPLEYTELTFYDYTFSNLVQKLKNSLGEAEFKPEEAQLRVLYEEYREALYSVEETIRIQKIAASFFKSDGSRDKDKMGQARKQMEKALELLAQGGSFENAAELYSDLYLAEGLGDQAFGARTARSDESDPVNAGLKKAAAGLKAGETSGILEISNRYYILRVLSREAGGYQSFKEVKDHLRALHVNQMYEAWLETAIEKAAVEISNDVYKRIRINED